MIEIIYHGNITSNIAAGILVRRRFITGRIERAILKRMFRTREHTHTYLYHIFFDDWAERIIWKCNTTRLMSFIDTCHFSTLKKLSIVSVIYLLKGLLGNTLKSFIKPASSENNSQYKSESIDNALTCLVEMCGPSSRDPPSSSLSFARIFNLTIYDQRRESKGQNRRQNGRGRWDTRARENTCRHFGIAVVVRYEDSQVLSNFKNLSRIILVEATGW